ncbi:hypothetical protein EPI10_000962 [Gossypium australe]|uniref:Uncharacterized protein n=1 Tax=Gossypium australe TaxID=47621 RepID=A0A5B6V9U0_9ROSI|nr:hypothetical protein EPI10_000962 [Gossypium australe]
MDPSSAPSPLPDPGFRSIEGTNPSCMSWKARQSDPGQHHARVRLKWVEVNRLWLNGQVLTIYNPWTLREYFVKIFHTLEFHQKVPIFNVHEPKRSGWLPQTANLIE